MPQENKHQQALEMVAAGNLEEAATLMANALGESESAEIWSDWATVKVAIGQNHGALTGYERALELDPQHVQATFNLGLLLVSQGALTRGLGYLQQVVDKVQGGDREAASALLSKHRAHLENASQAPAALDKFTPRSGPALEYFNTHRERYLNCLEMLPAAQPGQKLLELGASFHHLTPGLEALGYTIRCADIWEGDKQRTADLTSSDGTEHRQYTVDNFDLQQQRWPYDDGEFDVVVFCEILEHLNTDPMSVLSEINRVLKKDGLLLLSTPNMASAKSVNYVLAGNSPYVFGHFVPGGLPTDRHNREYTATEVEHLLQAAGFDIVTLETHNSWWKDQGHALGKLAAAGLPLAHRGDNTFALGKKVSAVNERYPEEFYCAEGSQAENRNSIAGKTARNILLIHEVLPHFDRSGSDMRFMQVIRRLRAQGHNVTCIGRSNANHEKYEVALQELGVTAYSGESDGLKALGIDVESTWKLDQVLRKGRFDTAILFHWFWSNLSVSEQYIDEIRKHSPATRVLVLTDDRHGIREWRGAELSRLPVDYERALCFLVREAECYRAADLVLAITEDDRKGLLEMVPELQVELLPMTADTQPSKAGFTDRKDFVFLANFDNLANRDAANWFCNEIWPRIHKRLPETRLYLAGNNFPADFAKKPGIEVLGYVPDLAATLERFRVFVSPIRYGTGIKTKNLTAMGNGIPLVTTTIGAEGMNLTDGENALICDAAGGFANKVVELYKDQQLWNKLAANGLKHIATEFSVERLDAQIEKILALAEKAVPQAHDPEHRFSFRLVEELHPDVLTATPPHLRQERRIFGYLEMAEKLARIGRPAEALEQARHIFCYLRGSSRSIFLARILSLLERCYRETGDVESANRCGQEAKLCLPELNPTFVKQVEKKNGNRARLSDHAISVIIPTYNRQKTLERCLDALVEQTLSSTDFEVIVVDDGSTDDTQEFLKQQKTPFRLSYFRQANQGAGAARKLGVDNARGEYLVLMNDDTIADPKMLDEHLLMQRKYHSSCFAVLGTFEYERAARRRALTHFLSVDPFMFPQLNMRPDFYYGHTHFITCNLSVRRDAVLAAGSFDPSFRLGEDTELGLRMAANGCKVVFHPEARAIHDHLEMTIDDMVRRAKNYGPVYLHLLRKHPTLRITHPGIDLGAPVTAADIERVRETLRGQRGQIDEMVKALKQYDNRDFEPAFAKLTGQGSAADLIVNLYRQAIPQVHWFHVLDGLCSAWTDEAPMPPAEIVGAGARI